MYIYKIINNQNNKIYVGQTKHTILKRWKEHIHVFKYGIKYNKHIKNSAIYQAMRKYGIDSFQIIELQKCNSINELNKSESFWIKKLNTLSPNGYNLNSGGNNPIFSLETKLKLSIAGKKNAKITPELLKFFEIGQKRKQKILFSKNILTNEIIIYSSLYEAGLKGFNRKAISRSINERTGIHKGYLWYYENIIPNKVKTTIKTVYMYDATGNFIKKYNSLKETILDGFLTSGVSQCCTGKIRKHKKYIFSFKEI